MRLDLAVYTLLLIVGLGLAYWAATPVDEKAAGKVAVVAFEGKRIAALSFTSDSDEGIVKVVANRRDDGQYWVDYSRTEPVKSPTTPDAKEPKDPKAEPVALPAPETITDRFLAGEKLLDLIGALNPLSAIRDLGKVSDDQLDEFGLKAPTAQFSIMTDDGKSYALALGKRSYGTRSRFVREVGDGSAGRVFLIDDAGIEDLERANVRLYERRLVAIEFDDVSKAEIGAAGKSRRMAHTQRDKNGELTWTADEDKAPPAPSYASWMDKLSKLRLAAFATEAEAQSLQGLEPFLTVALEKDGKVIDTIEFRKTMRDGKQEYYVISDFLKTPAKLTSARIEPIEKDLVTILDGAT